MSTFLNPVGPQSSKVYWRRRIVVGLALLAVIVIVLLLFFQPRGGTTPTPSSSSSSEPSQAPTTQDDACAAGVVEVTAATDKSSYAAGEKPQLTLTLTNVGATACTFNAGTTQQEFLITSGDELYWSSRHCQTGAVDASVILQPDLPQSTDPLVWDRTRSSTATCDSGGATVPASGASYHLNINVGELKSNDVQFILE